MSQKSLARCPSCGKVKDVDHQAELLRAEQVWFQREASRSDRRSPFYPLEGGMRTLAASGNTRWFWACDACIHEGRAVRADIAAQNLGLGTPFAAYVDRPFRCDACGQQAVFTAREQQHWFERLHFLIWVYPKQCAPCRAQIRRTKRTAGALARALEGLDSNDPEQLESLARLYDQLGNTRKATEFRARARNRRRTR